MAVQAQEEERYRLAIYLQQGPAQLFANAAVEIETFLQLLESEPESARAGLLSLGAELRQALADIRGMITELQPPLLVELGLAASLHRYAAEFSRRAGIAVTLVGWQSLAERLPATMETAIFRIIQEALENIRTHAHATEAQIRLEISHEQLMLTIADNGQGFCANGGLAEKRRLGLVAMSDRAKLLGGQLQIFSQPARGVRVVLTVPLHDPGG
jgi:two-component system sensor histidine kinase DegS